MQEEPGPRQPRPLDLLIAAFALLVLGIAGAAVVAWDTARRVLDRRA